MSLRRFNKWPFVGTYGAGGAGIKGYQKRKPQQREISVRYDMREGVTQGEGGRHELHDPQRPYKLTENSFPWRVL